MKLNAPLTIWILVFCFSCNNAYRELEPTASPNVLHTGLQSIFYGQDRAFAYDTGVQFQSNYVSGLLFIKPESEDRYRIAMTTKMGQKIFDFSLDQQHFTVNYCLPQLNRKIVLTQLERDLHLITDSYLPPQELDIFDDQAKRTVYRLKRQKDYLHYHYDNATSQLVRIESGSKRKPQVIAELSDYQEGFPHRIHLDHNLLFKLKLDLKWVALNK